MKTLLALRHAKASPDSPSGMDFDRPLNARGQADALAVGRAIRERHLAVDAILASPAVRVVETLSGVLEGAGSTVEPDYDRRLYNASPQTLLAVMHEVDDRVDRLLVVGHNPGLKHLLLHLAEDDRDGLRGEVAFSFPTATLAELGLSVDHWRDVERNSGRLVRLFQPRDLDPAAAGPD